MINDRNIPDKPLKPNFDVRPQPTKYTDFQVFEPKVSSKVPLLKYPKSGFNPGYRGPTEEGLEKVDLESYLRNQYMALQRNSQAQYVPNINSDLYNHPMNYEKQYSSFSSSHTRLCKTLDPNIFHNSTRYYLKKE
jgi:hypothetical protein